VEKGNVVKEKQKNYRLSEIISSNPNTNGRACRLRLCIKTAMLTVSHIYVLQHSYRLQRTGVL